MGQVIEGGMRINGRYNASRGLNPWAQQAESGAANDRLRSELETTRAQLERAKGVASVLRCDNERLRAMQARHMRDKFAEYERPRKRGADIPAAMLMTFALGALVGVGIAMLAVVIALGTPV